MNDIELEVAAYSVASVRVAAAAGATRAELCSSAPEGGTTPSAAAIAAACQAGIPVFVMLRPRSGDFCYDADEFALMQADMEHARRLGAAGFVLGLLLPNGHVDVPRTQLLVQQAGPLPVTFHRAFDMAASLPEALEAVIATGCRRILTSGGHNKAPEATGVLAGLVQQAAGRITLMAGSGVRPQHARLLLETGLGALHLSALTARPGQMQFRKNGVSMGTGASEYSVPIADAEMIARMRQEIDAYTLGR